MGTNSCLLGHALKIVLVVCLEKWSSSQNMLNFYESFSSKLVVIVDSNAPGLWDTFAVSQLQTSSIRISQEGEKDSGLCLFVFLSLADKYARGFDTLI